MAFKSRKINAARTCRFISKIGYENYSAIEDIIDNSISANAKNIIVEFELIEGSTANEKNNVSLIRIIDDGDGMDNDKIEKALDIGSIIDYPENSLSKYGLGLKSAGLSLGDCVTIYSKQNNVHTYVSKLDLELIESKNEYGVDVVDLDENIFSKLKEFEHGTCVEISKTHRPQDSAKKIIDKLIERLGVLYYFFIKNKGLSIKINYRTKSLEIQPKDILFIEDAVANFDPDNYDCKSPYKVTKQDACIEVTDGANKYNVSVKGIIFPKDEMKNFKGFSDDERKKIDSYDIGRQNRGFFIYRNNRLIRWGDTLGIVGKDYYGFRGMIHITDDQDDILHVDVSKQRLQLPEEFTNALAEMCKIPLSQSKEAFNLCSKLIDSGKDGEGEDASSTLSSFAEEDPDDVTPTSSAEKKQRRAAATKQTKQKLEEESEAIPEEQEEFNKVRYSDKITSTDIWSPEFDADNGTFVRINKNHRFYSNVLQGLAPDDKNRTLLEIMLFILSAGENKTKESIQDVDYELMSKIFNKFRMLVSYNLDLWLSQNQGKFD